MQVFQYRFPVYILQPFFYTFHCLFFKTDYVCAIELSGRPKSERRKELFYIPDSSSRASGLNSFQLPDNGFLTSGLVAVRDASQPMIAFLRTLPQWYCPISPLAFITLWQGIRKATGLFPMAVPTALDAPVLPDLFASSE